MKNKRLINQLSLAFVSMLLCTIFPSCSKKEPYIITYKSVLTNNPSFAQYWYYQNEWDEYAIIDSANKYNIGDDVRVVK